HDIVNVGLVKGVDVALHGSRHLPNGADPLTTAAPSASLSATTTNAVGIANSLARSDHSHAVLTGTPATIVPDQANAAGSSANLARADHVHQVVTGAAVSVGTANSGGGGGTTTFAKSDHVHQGVHSVNANGGAQRYGDLVLQQGAGVTITESPAGTFV